MRDFGIFWAVNWYRDSLENNRGLKGIPSKCSYSIDATPALRATRANEHSPGKYVPGLTRDEEPGIPHPDRAPAFGAAIADQREEAKFPRSAIHHKLQFLSNVAEANPSKLGMSIRPSLGFPSMQTVNRTLKGFKVTSALSKDQTIIWRYGDSAMGEECPIDGQLGIYAA
jgi:hypothetical protein